MGHLSRAAQDMQPTLTCPAYADVRCIDKGARGDSLPRHMNSCPAYRDMTAEQKQLFPEPVLATVGHIRAVKHMARFGYPLVQQPVALVWNSATPWAQPPPFASYPPYVPQASSSFAPPPAPSVPLPQQPPVFAPQQHQLTPAPPQAGVQKPVVPAQQPLAAASHTSAVPAASATHRPDNRPRPRPMVKPLAATYSSFFSQLEQTRGSTASTPPAPSSVCQSPSAAKTTTTAPCVPLLQAVTAPSPASQPPKEQVLDRSASPQSSYSERPESAFDSPLLSFEDSPPTSVAESPSPSQDECATEETCTAPIGSPAPVEAPHVQLPIAASESSSVRTAASDFSMEMLFSLDDLSGPFRSSPVGEWLPQPISLPPVEDIAANIWSPAPSNASFGGGFLDIGDFNLFLDEHEHQFSTEFGQ
ncbi:hypothetical protein BV25DRAFT_1832373 [Artomyces pyxidatus]|uniref:Uncharacterized protein n=1 Tax=Artomyces pyxidatus TaxID=48021 RepID=A0ACB8SIW2_9AGAM|nr:hypothetical protein BV25DRAFT_1832373 [Artomyces pyxidatus]